MKKILIATLLALSLAACGEGPDSTVRDSDAEYTVVCIDGHEYLEYYYSAMPHYVVEDGVSIVARCEE